MILTLFVTPLVSQAASISLPTSSQTYQEGQSISVRVLLHPDAGKPLYTAKLDLSYSTEVLQLSSFVQASGWIPLQQPGYHETNFSTGNVIRTGGYTGGVSNTVEFGTLTFIAKSSGQGKLSLNGAGILLLDQNNDNLFVSNNATASFSVVPKPVVKPAPVKTTPKKDVVTVEEKKEKVKETPVLAEEPLVLGQTASLSPAERIVENMMPHIYYLLLGLVSFVLNYTWLVYIILLVGLYYLVSWVVKVIA